MKIVLMGPAGSGKGTIGEMLSEHFNLSQVSLGQTLREIPESHPWHDIVKKQLEEGVLVDQEKAAYILREELSQEKYENGFVLDGWFRSMENIRLYFPEIDKFILLNISPEESIKRLSSRRTCEKCGDVYNLISKPSLKSGLCDECGGNLIQRDDDVPKAIQKRLYIYQNETGEVIDYFRAQNRLIEIDGSGTPEEVFQLVLPTLE